MRPPRPLRLVLSPPLCSTLRRPRASTSSFIPVSYYRDCNGYRIWIGSRPGTPLNRVLHQEKQHPRAPASRTGVPDKYYRGAQQASSCDCRPPATVIRINKPKFTPCSTLREPTGVPDKRYRGAQQVLPGRPTNITGVPDKYYRGAQQVLPGRPTNITGVPNKPSLRNMLQNGTFCLCSEGPFVIVSLVVLCCLNNNYKENGEGYPWGPIASS